ncbi:unnamed protein product [Candidula unifasciata]|uniref:ETFB lysine methyltransferase n=1 Tax=Candidula unifasciata TaxID=100452 RepID=A0A8S3YPB2_9EUPU|nr:unnamed protein product [Candidula unifasciata]
MLALNKSFLRALIIQHTKLCRNHLTPELKLHLITQECHLWKAGVDNCPFEDPFWAFYWPGGQALTRYILDNPVLFKNRRVLDIGSGCGSAAIASCLVGASQVVANDIDPAASVAIEINMEKNGADVQISTENFLENPPSEQYDTVLFGDMFYDPDFSHLISHWVKKLPHKTTVFIGDPGRLPFLNHPLKSALQKAARYELPITCQLENNGLTQADVWKYIVSK